MAANSPVPLPDSIHRFFRPFFDTGNGLILALASIVDIRDVWAVAFLYRLFPSWHCPGVKLVGSGRDVPPADHVIVVGSLVLFVDADGFEIVSDPRPLGLPEGHPIRERLVRVINQAVLQIIEREDTKERVVRDGLTAEEFVPSRSPFYKDYGIIRRIWDGVQWVLVLEGVHKRGTLGVTMVVTSEELLQRIYEALDQLEDYDEHDPIEVLVEASTPSSKGKSFDASDVHPRPIRMIHRGERVYDFERSQWRELSSWNLVVQLEKEYPPKVVEDEDDTRGRRLVVRGDLSELPEEDRGVIERALRRGRVETDKEFFAVMDLVAEHSERFSLTLAKHGKYGSGIGKSLPDKTRTPLKMMRARLVLMLVVARMIGRELRMELAEIQRWFPRADCSESEHRTWFRKKVRGAIETGFAKLFAGPGRAMSIAGDAGKTYSLHLDDCVVFLKLRF